MVSSPHGRVFLPQVHLQVAEKVHIFPRWERQHCTCMDNVILSVSTFYCTITFMLQQRGMRTDCAHDSCIQQHFSAARLEHSALQGGDQVAHMEIHNILQLVGGAV